MTRGWLGWVLCVAACGGDTEGRSITLHWTAGSEQQAERNRQFTTDTGWDVSLDEARVALGPIFAIAPAEDTVDAVAELLRQALVSVAHAHGGHDAAGGLRVRTELLEPVVLDALASDVVRLDTTEGEEGAVDSVKFEIAKSSSKLPDVLHGHQAYLRGRAQRGAEQVLFEGGLVELPDDEPARRVESDVNFSLRDAGTLALSVNVSEWLRAAEFEQLSPPAGGGTATITAENQVGRAWKVGVRAPAAFGVTFEAKEP